MSEGEILIPKECKALWYAIQEYSESCVERSWVSDRGMAGSQVQQYAEHRKISCGQKVRVQLNQLIAEIQGAKGE